MISSTAPTSSDCRWPPSSPSAISTRVAHEGDQPEHAEQRGEDAKITYGLYMM